jgi:hypothetical protein
MSIGIMVEDDVAATELASSVAIDEANLSIDLTIDSLLSEREFLAVSLVKDLELFSPSS